MPVQGLVRLRAHQFARQALFGTKVAAVRRYPFSGTPSVDLAWTDPEIDAGSRDPVAPPFRGPSELTASLTAPSLTYNDLPIMHAAFFGGEEVPVGGAGDGETWTYEPSSTTTEEPDPHTYEFGDDVTTDWFQFGDGVLESVEFSGPEGLGPLSATMSWRFGSVASSGSTDSPDSPTVPTAGLSVATDDIVVYLKDMGIYIASSVAGLAAGQVTDALHSFTMRWTQELDLKRYANGSQTFDIDAYGPGTRGIELECVFAKTADTVGLGSESDAWMSDNSVNRYVRLVFTSTANVSTGPDVPYSWTVTMPMRYYTREEGEIGGNTTVVLTGHAFYDPDDLGEVINSVIVNTLTEDELGEAGS
jgi:hypothetical protein